MQQILEDLSDDELVQHIRSNPGPGHMSYEQARYVLLTTATVRVADEVRKFSKCSAFLALAMIGLTVVIGYLTYLMLCAAK